MAGMRLSAIVAIGLALGLAFQLSIVRGSGRTTTPEILVKYSGRLDTSWEPIMKQPDGRNYHVARYTWSLSWRGRLDEINPTAPLIFKVEKLRGTVTYVDNTSAEHADCNGSFVKRPGAKLTLRATVNDAQSWVGFRPVFPVSTEFLVPTNTTSLHEFCGEVVRWGLPDRYRIPYYQFSTKGNGGARTSKRTIGPTGVNREKSVLTTTFSVKL
jgi:hypothetical protein